MKTTVIYHRADFDGLFCREIAKKFLPEAELVGWDFGDGVVCVPEGRVYILDLPVDRVLGFDYAEEGEPFKLHDVVWIDHHKSSIETHPKDIPGYRIDGVAACRLAWQWFAQHRYDDGTGFCARADKEDFVNRKVTEPLAVRLAGEYDIWDKRDPNAELFQHGLRSEPITDGDWMIMLSPESGEFWVKRLLEQGKVLQYARAQEYAEVIKQQGFDVEFEGLKFLACNSHELDIRSHLFAAGVRPEHEGLLGFTYHGKGWRVSLYHAPGKEGHDLSVIAKKYGGGGHRGACGFQCGTLPFMTNY